MRGRRVGQRRARQRADRLRRGRSRRVDGSPVSRVRITLAQPVAHHVRAERNRILIDFDRPSQSGIPTVAPPARARRSKRRRRPGRSASPRCGLTPATRTETKPGPRNRRLAVPAAAPVGCGGRTAGAAAALGPPSRSGAPHLHRKSGQPRLPGRRPARGAAHVLPKSAASTSSSIRRCREPWTWRFATCRGTRRSTSSCAPTSWATWSTAPSCGSRR